MRDKQAKRLQERNTAHLEVRQALKGAEASDREVIEEHNAAIAATGAEPIPPEGFALPQTKALRSQVAGFRYGW